MKFFNMKPSDVYLSQFDFFKQALENMFEKKQSKSNLSYLRVLPFGVPVNEIRQISDHVWNKFQSIF